MTDLEKKLNALNADLEAIKTSSNQVEGQQQEPNLGRKYEAPVSTHAPGGEVSMSPTFDFGKAPAELHGSGPMQSHN